MRVSIGSIVRRSVFELFFVIVVFGMIAIPVEAKRRHPENFYQKHWCEKVGGIIEYRLKDRTRVDCLTSQYAIEFDFGSKWAEALGQALHYSLMTGKEPGIVLILENKKDRKYWRRLNKIIQRYGLKIKVWSIGVSGEEEGFRKG